jgi:hypothetical protein
MKISKGYRGHFRVILKDFQCCDTAELSRPVVMQCKQVMEQADLVYHPNESWFVARLKRYQTRPKQHGLRHDLVAPGEKLSDYLSEKDAISKWKQIVPPKERQLINSRDLTTRWSQNETN